MGLTVNIIGSGNLGKTIGRLFVKNKLATINGIYNRNIKNSMDAIQFIGEGSAYKNIVDLPHADITFIATPDDAIAEACLTLSQNTNLKKWSIIAHCSGVQTSDILSPLKENGRYTASIHPMHSFANPEVSIESFVNTYCAVEGDAEATKTLTRLFDSMGAITYPISKDKKSIYHASGIFASNYLVTLFHQAVTCLKTAGVEGKTSMEAILHLMKGTLSNLEKTMSAEKSLTGPIQRGDTKTLIDHLNALDKPIQKQLYALLGKSTLELTQHDAVRIDELHRALSESQ